MTDPVYRQWAVFADDSNPRIVMIGHTSTEGQNWSPLSIDRQRSTERVTIWIGDDGQPQMIEAQGGDDLRALETEIRTIVYTDKPDLAGSWTLDVMGFEGWTWWHPMVVSVDPLQDQPDVFMEALERARENQKANRHRTE